MADIADWFVWVATAIGINVASMAIWKKMNQPKKPKEPKEHKEHHFKNPFKKHKDEKYDTAIIPYLPPDEQNYYYYTPTNKKKRKSKKKQFNPG